MGKIISAILLSILGLLMLPLVVSVTQNAAVELTGIRDTGEYLILYGIIGYVLMHLFIYEPKSLYAFGHRLMSEIFKFAGGAAGILANLVPLFLTALLIFLYFNVVVFKIPGINNYMLFFTGFFFAMHIILAARQLNESQSGTGKAVYLVSIQLIYILTLFLVIGVLSLIAKGVSFQHFIGEFLKTAKHLYILVYTYLFRV